MKQANEPMITLTDTNTTTRQMITPEMQEQLQQLECWRRDQTWTEEVMHGLAANGGADQSKLFFAQVMYTIRATAPENLVRFMNTYVRGLKDGVHVEDSLEYAVTFQQADLLREILARYEGNDAWDEWTKVYAFLLDGIEGKLTYQAILQCSNELIRAVDDPALQLRLGLTKVFSCANLGHLDELNTLLDQFQKRISVMDLNFMNSALLSRVSIERANLLLYSEGNIAEAEKHFIQVISNDATNHAMLSHARHSLGLATLCKSKELCLGHYQQAIAHAKQAGLEHHYKDLTTNYYPFARNVHGEYFDVKDIVPEECVHQYIVRGEMEMALQLIDQLEADGEGSAFLTFYRGKATGNIDLLLQVRERFKKDHYGHMLPLVDQELVKEGEVRK